MPSEQNGSSPKKLEEAIQTIQSGDLQRGRSLLARVLQENPRDAQAWLWLAACWETPEKQRYCLEKALELRPDDKHIQEALERLPIETGSPPVPPEEMLPDSSKASRQDAGEHFTQADSPAGTPPGANPPVIKEKPPKRNSFWSGILLVLLGLLALASIGLLILVLFQSEFLFLPPPSSPPTAAVSEMAEIPVFQLPPTWTPTPAPTQSPTPEPRLSGTIPPSATRLPSITPVTPSYDQWRLIIGQSTQGRPIEVFRFGIGSRERMIIAGMHGISGADSVALADLLIEHLQANPPLVPKDMTLYILRSLNPDGEALGQSSSGKFNANGVDLNRNFPENWKSAWESQGCLSSDPDSAGPAPLSETETQALAKFLSARKVQVLINFRSGGQGIYAARGGADLKSAALAQAISDLEGFSFPPLDDPCEYTGTLIDWALTREIQAAVDIAPAVPEDLNFERQLKILNLLLSWDPANPEIAARTPTVTPGLAPTSNTTLPQTATPTPTAPPSENALSTTVTNTPTASTAP